MKGLTLERICQVCRGRYEGPEKMSGTQIGGVSTDSRRISEGDLFAAFDGEHFDGHRFISDVFKKGACCALIEKELPQETRKILEEQGITAVLIRVESTKQALIDMASWYRSTLSIPVIGVTGSVGKTSTKETIAAVLSEKYCVHKTDGNFNNDLGLPLTILKIREEHEIAVLEMGISHFGDMQILTRIARPDICVITNIGNCHLEHLGDRDGVLKAKSEIFECMNPKGYAVLNGDDDKLAAVTEVPGGRLYRFGLEETNDFRTGKVESRGLRGTYAELVCPDGSVIEAEIPIPGVHMVMNVLAACAVARNQGLTVEEISRGIARIVPLEGRGRLIETERYLLVEDCYNANPASMASSLKVLKSADGRRVAILGDMLELGKNAAELHRDVGRKAVELETDLLLCVGALGAEIAAGAREAGEKTDIYMYENGEELLADLPNRLKEKDTILIKASHGMHFEKIVESLTTAQTV